VISAGIKEVYYETSFNKGEKAMVRDLFVSEDLVKLKQIYLSEAITQKAADFLLKPTSIPQS
jgi:dCMP deaminase